MKTWEKEIIIYLAIIVLVLLIKTFAISPIKVNGSSMEPTLKDKDIMLLNKVTYKIHDIERFDIVVIDDNDTHIIKRIIGLPGDKVEYSDGVLYINEKKVKENFEHGVTEDFLVEEVDEGYYFVLGDNRENSLDSRILGPIAEKEILGVATYTIYPFSRFGSKK